MSSTTIEGNLYVKGCEDGECAYGRVSTNSTAISAYRGVPLASRERRPPLTASVASLLQ